MYGVHEATSYLASHISGCARNRFGLGLFDDDDSPSGRGGRDSKLAVAQDLFVHHFGSRIFTGNGVDTNRLLDKNATKFAAKWGNAVPQKLRVTLRPFSPRPQTHQQGAIDPQMSQRSVCSVVKSSSEPMLGRFVRSWIIRVHLCYLWRDNSVLLLWQSNNPCSSDRLCGSRQFVAYSNLKMSVEAGLMLTLGSWRAIVIIGKQKDHCPRRHFLSPACIDTAENSHLLRAQRPGRHLTGRGDPTPSRR